MPSRISRNCLLSRMKIDAVHFVLRRLHDAMEEMEEMEDMEMAPQIKISMEIYGKYMGNIWEIYGKYMGNIWVCLKMLG